MQGPKNHSGSAVGNRAYGMQVNGSAVGNRAYPGPEAEAVGNRAYGTRVTGRRRWKPRLWNAGYRQRRLETEPPERRFPVGAVCNRAYQGREQTSL